MNSIFLLFLELKNIYILLTGDREKSPKYLQIITKPNFNLRFQPLY